MTAAPAPGPAPTAIQDPTRGARPPAARIVLLSAVGAVVAWALGAGRPSDPGARVLASPATLLAAFDTLWLLVILGRTSTAGRVALLAAGVPFHAAAAAAAGVPAAHHGATAVLLLSFAAVGASAPATGRLAGLPLALVVAGLPMVGYVLVEFLSAPVGLRLLQASPLTAPALLLRGAGVEGVAAAVPAAVAAAVVLAANLLLARGGPRPGREEAGG